MSVDIRRMTASDLEQVAALPASDNSVWNAGDYLSLDTIVALTEGQRIIGFAAARTLVENEEHEILNVWVDPAERGRGIGSNLLKTLLTSNEGLWFLEVRSSNAVAIRLYKSIGFSDFGRRKGYYQNPYEDAIVMRFRS